jgi:hypothetical protein
MRIDRKIFDKTSWYILSAEKSSLRMKPRGSIDYGREKATALKSGSIINGVSHILQGKSQPGKSEFILNDDSKSLVEVVEGRDSDCSNPEISICPLSKIMPFQLLDALSALKNILAPSRVLTTSSEFLISRVMAFLRVVMSFAACLCSFEVGVLENIWKIISTCF